MKFNCKLIAMLYLLLSFVGAMAFVPPGSENAIKKINKSFVSLCRSNRFSGAALVAINGKIRFEKACGLASRNFRVPNTLKTKFNLGSVGKLFTVVSIAQLIEAKKISLQTPVFNLIPSWLPMRYGRLITVEQLLIHASGLGNFMNDKRWQLGADSGLYVNTDDYKHLISEKRLLFKPGASQAYSNSGYLVLGRIIERLSKESYSQYIKYHIFDIANMSDTGIYSLDEIVRNRAVGYYYSCIKSTCQWKNNYFEAPFVGTSAGGAYSTVGDLFKFTQFLYHQKLLKKALTKQLLSTAIVQPSHDISIKFIKIGNLRVPENFSPYGFAGAWNKFGFAVWNKPALIGHTGGTAGASALFLMSPDNKYTIIILSNISSGTILLYQKIRAACGFKGGIRNF